MRTLFGILMFLCVAYGAAQTPVDSASTGGGEARRVNIYRVNLFTLRPSAVLDSLTAEIDRAGRRLSTVWVAGSASPEGPPWWNRELGHRRARALYDYLLQHTSLTPERLQRTNLGEDWEGTRRAIEGTDFPHAARIIAIIDSTDDWELRKQQIRAIDRGRTWRRLVRDVFPPLRNSRVWMAEVRGIATEDLGIQPADVTLRAEASPIVIVGEGLPITSGQRPAPPVIALKTNLLGAAATVANLGLEVQMGRRWSLDLPVYYSPYDLTPRRKLRLLAAQPALRYWPRGAMRRGFFAEVHGTVAGFNIAVNDRGRYQDPERAAWGLGLGGGWGTLLGPRGRWALQCNLGLGFIRYRYHDFENRPHGALRHEGRGTWWGPTRAAVAIAYQWPMAKKARKQKH